MGHIPNEPAISQLTQAIFSVNRHAKTAPDPKYLYLLKRKALERLVSEGKAKKIGLHFSRNPKNSKQQSDVLVLAGDYYFHMPSSKEDFAQLPHLGSLNQTYRNPKSNMSLSQAKEILQNYVGISPSRATLQKKSSYRKYQKPVFKRLGDSY
ncbi:hypothetical protein FZW96_10425 [Bacillus sp. BGMRC 2118]|nr:hypothetical protein FZW96_10425 [Bacillus sp. BGMRC 2118]